VRSRAQVDALRRACLYAPGGSRSISLAHPVAAYGRTAVADYVGSLEPPLVVAQVETLETDDPLAEICAAAPDVVFVGALDLLVDAGLDEARAAARRDEIVDAAEAARIAVGGPGADYRYSVVSSDVALLREALAAVR
jgi:4-hydroxy-2-oxoheptanedioate aldolase